MHWALEIQTCDKSRIRLCPGCCVGKAKTSQELMHLRLKAKVLRVRIYLGQHTILPEPRFSFLQIQRQ